MDDTPSGVMKRCANPVCHKMLPLDHFHKDRTSHDGHMYRCKSCENERGRAYRTAHPEVARQQRVSSKKAHPEKHRRRKVAYRKAHPEKSRKRTAAYSKAHPEKVRQRDARRRARKIGAPVCDFTAAQWQDMKTLYQNRCVYCGKGKQRLTQDHVIPLSRGGSHTWDNIVPACASCNRSKWTNAPLIPVQGFLQMSV
jgi:5-methylcytosine-specific restriction endonuclease McrA